MQMMIGNGAILLNNRRLLDGEYHLVRDGSDSEPPAWSGYIDVTGQSRDALTEIVRWCEARPGGLLFAAQNGGTLPVSQLEHEGVDLETGQARFAIVFAAAKKE